MKNIVMPAAGQTTNVATVTKIKVSVGEKVKRGQVLMEVETDKAVLPIESYTAGLIVSVRVKEFDQVDAGDLLMEIGNEEELAASRTRKEEEPAVEKTAPAGETSALSSDSDGEEDDFVPIFPGKKEEVAEKTTAQPSGTSPDAADAYPAMPNAKRLARERGVSLSGLRPSNGVFLKRGDIPDSAVCLPDSSLVEEIGSAAPTSDSALLYEVLPVSGARRGFAKKMEDGARIPALTLSVTADLSGILALRAAAGSEIPLSAMVIRAVAALSDRYPLFRTQYVKEELRVYREADPALAVNTENGFLPLPLRGKARGTLSEIKEECARLASLAEAGDLSVTGGASTVIHDGSAYGVPAVFPALTSPGLCAIGIGGEGFPAPVQKDGVFVSLPSVTVTGVFDARYVDAPVAASAMNELKALLENPALMLV